MIIGSFGMSGTKGLRVTSIILILMGLASILLTYFLAHEVDASDITVSSLEALKSLILAYASAGFQVLVGLIGLILSKKKINYYGYFGNNFIYSTVTLFHAFGC